MVQATRPPPELRLVLAAPVRTASFMLRRPPMELRRRLSCRCSFHGTSLYWVFHFLPKISTSKHEYMIRRTRREIPLSFPAIWGDHQKTTCIVAQRLEPLFWYLGWEGRSSVLDIFHFAGQHFGIWWCGCILILLLLNWAWWSVEFVVGPCHWELMVGICPQKLTCNTPVTEHDFTMDVHLAPSLLNINSALSNWTTCHPKGNKLFQPSFSCQVL